MDRHWYSLSKRIVDIALALAVLAVSLPLWCLIAVLVKVDSKGPVIFQHRRIGQGGRSFLMRKFRSMHVCVGEYEPSPVTDRDPRVTRVGQWLRRCGLDEMPQVLNVIAGNMSFVGPRPEIPTVVREYSDRERKRLSVKPGVTGLWQVLGRRGHPIHEDLEYDLYYIEHQSWSLDLWIIRRTIPTILGRKPVKSSWDISGEDEG